MPKRLIAVLLVVLCLGLGGLAYLLTHGNTQVTAPVQTTLDIGGDFTLIRQDGKRVSSAVYNDKYKLVYFGFTHCPAICPTELQKMATAMSLLPKDTAQKIQPIFISVDPERDTPAVLNDFMPLFGDNFIGFTGSKSEIETVKKQYRIYAAKIQEQGAKSYTVDHSSYIYFLGKDSKMINLFDTQDTAQDIAKSIEAAKL